MNEFSRAIKEISGKRNKTDADYEKMAELEWRGGLYLNEYDQIIIPSNVLEAAFVNGAKKTKSGKQAQAGLFVHEDAILKFPHSTLSIGELWNMPEYRLAVGVRVQTSRIMRTRPKFTEWGIDATIVYDEGIFNRNKVLDIIKTSGDIVGVGDWRPKYGRFEVK